MTLRPHESHVRFVGYDSPMVDFDYMCVVPWCKNPALDTHHVWRRSALGRAFNSVLDKDTGDVLRNTISICRSHHNDLTDNRAQIVYAESDKTYYWKSLRPILDTPDFGPLDIDALANPLSDNHGPSVVEQGLVAQREPVVIAERTMGTDAPRGDVGPQPGLPPGSTCVVCKRKVPYPRTASSPTSKTKSFRLPLDEVGAFDDLLGAAEEIVGVHSQPFATFKVLLAALALVVQSPSEVRELLERRAA